MVGSIAVLTLFFGTNDSVMEGYKQHVPLDDFKAKMKEMLQYLLSIGLANEKIVIITPPRVNETAWEKECKRHLGHPKNKTNEITSKYAEVCCHLGQAFHIDVLDLFNVMLREQNWERFLLSDGIHLSVDGAKLLHQHLLPIVLKKTSHLPTRFPLWRDVDDMHPENSLLQ
uniref:Isoamyl acetate-hydrolyzing esterase 1 homolog n=1 Tax=Saccoglossus kowalevskii TaxID=10224 RepID=A0ABM0MW12_SACKO|nr:PREDICTED: isoamyl acetate-hydrolyzing esterase 1 homolog [Saccoglossus kowalevskii]